MTAMTTVGKYKDLVLRAFNTFWQGFSAAFLMPDSFWDLGAWEAIGVGAAGAGLSALKTFVVGLLSDKTFK